MTDVVFELVSQIELALSFLVIFCALCYKTIKHIEQRKENDDIFFEEIRETSGVGFSEGARKGSKVFSYTNIKALFTEYSPWIFLNFARLFMFG
jgi:hypothetical protein